VPALKTDTDVLIAGAGPAGLALAAELRRRGISPLTIDRQPAGANTSRACVVHARTMEVLEPLGVTRELLAQGVRVPIFRVRDRDRVLITIDFSHIASPYPFTLMVPQDRVEQCLLNHFESRGGGVVRPCELVSYNASASQVEVQVKAAGVAKTIEARWLIGCDGMHSTVREQSRVAFTGAAYEQSFVLADVHMHWPLSRDEVTLFFSPDGLVVVAPLPEDRFRIVSHGGQCARIAVSGFRPAPIRCSRPIRESRPYSRRGLELPVSHPPSRRAKPAQEPYSAVRRCRACAQPCRRAGL